MSLAPGSRIAQYEIIGPLGSGGMGEVYRARDLRLEREVAIKVMADHIALDPEMRRRFETEVRAIAALSHPSILSIYELAMADDRPVAVVELLEGETLRTRLRRGTLPWREAAQIAATVADGLGAAHAKGVVHRDLKPENIFLTSEGAVKVLDFGLALQRLSVAALADGPTVAHTEQGVVLGTFGYMSPEQVTGERVDGRSDIFACGCVLYEMLAGRRLFEGSTPQEVIANLLHDAVPPVSGFDPLAPIELRAIVSRCVDRDPSRRFDSAQDLAMALRSLLTGSTARAGGRRPRARGKSLAVLPFLNASGDPQLDYIGDGITESIINSLSQLSGIRVIPRSLAFRYKGLQADPATVGLALNARTILTGRIVQRGDVLNIQAELVDTSNESQLWGDQFRQSASDLMTVQEEIAWQISEALRLKLTGAQKKKLRKKPTLNSEAYQEYLRGRFHWNSWTPDGFRRALEHFERAIAHDPLYVAGYAGLGDALAAMAYYGLIPPAEAFPRARAAALRAVELDPENGEAHVTLGIERMFWGWDWEGAEREFTTSIRLAPKLALARAVFVLFLAASGRHEQALEQALLARELDPLSPFVNMGVAWAHHFAGEHEKAIREALRTREIVPGFEEAGNALISAYEALGRYEDAARLIRQQRCWGITLDGKELAEEFLRGGPSAYWAKCLEQLERVRSEVPSPMLYRAFAVAYQRLNMPERAIDYLELMIQERLPGAIFLATDPYITSLHGNPRYDAVITRVGVPLRRKASAPHTA